MYVDTSIWIFYENYTDLNRLKMLILEYKTIEDFSCLNGGLEFRSQGEL